MYPTDLTETQWQFIEKVLLPQESENIVYNRYGMPCSI
ncbi:hypothetical protein EZS27_005053 [termite gut metagenome]|uniref:Uncharacterized protein n=1 Tax=termite gut metagenome TaxID=433724 RepID=A0A5J4SNL0_9ZZZZ